MSRRRGFTYAEMMVVLTVVVLMASVLLPRFDAMERSRELKHFKWGLSDLVVEARTRAVESGDTVALGYDKAARELFTLHEGQNGQGRRLGTLKVPESVSVTQFSADQRESETDGWRVPFFADGTSAGGGVEFAYRDEVFSLSVQRGNGKPMLVPGQAPNMNLDEWEAGSYAPRAQTP